MDPLEALLDAAVEYFETSLAGVTVRKGWPEVGTDLDLDVGPHLSITPVGQPEETPRAATFLGAGLYKTATVEQRLQVDLWTAYKAQRAATGALVEAALRPNVPRTPNLWLTLDGYHDRPATLMVVADSLQDDGNNAPRGEWRRRWVLRAYTDRVVSTAVVPIVEAAATLTALDGTGEVIAAEETP